MNDLFSGECDVFNHLDDLAQRGEAFYEKHLRSKLEATHRDKFVAIEPESQDYFLGRTLSEAVQAARHARPDRQVFVMRVGHRAAVEFGCSLD